MIKFQLYLRKLIIQSFKISVQVTIGISRLKWSTSTQITIQLAVVLLFSKKQAFQNADRSNQRLGNYLESYMGRRLCTLICAMFFCIFN